MKYGCCLNMNAKDQYGIGFDDFSIFKNAGFDYVELPLAETMRLDHELFEEFLCKIADSGIACEVCNNFYPPDIRLTGGDVKKDQVLEYSKKALEKASRMGAQKVVFGSGKAKNLPKGFPRREGYVQIVELLQYVGDIAKTYDIQIVIEPLRKEECNLINTFEEGVRLSEDVNHSNVHNLVDLYHLSEENENIENISTYGGKILEHVHIANPEGRGFPKLTDACSELYKVFANELKKIGYSQRISCEAYSLCLERDAKESLIMMQKIFGENGRQENG